MFCENCGKEIKDNEKFCQNCGQPITQTNTTNRTYTNVKNRNNIPKPTRKKLVVIAGIIAAIVIAVIIISRNTLDVEYSNNDGGKLPIVVDDIFIDSAWIDLYDYDVTLRMNNLTDKNYREVKLVFLAWDENGLPIKFDEDLDFEEGYLKFLLLDNMAAHGTEELTWNITDEEISYVSVFLASCTDYEDVTWENPILDDVREMAGETLEDIPIYYYTMN